MAFQSKVNFFSGHPVVDPKMTGESENVNLNLASYCGNNWAIMTVQGLCPLLCSVLIQK